MVKDWKYFRGIDSDYKRAKNLKMTIACLVRALELIPDSSCHDKAELKNSLAFYYSECGDYVNAETLAREAVALSRLFKIEIERLNQCFKLGRMLHLHWLRTPLLSRHNQPHQHGSGIKNHG
jgi:tetratricopeptide (TPR) repeat protein